MTDVEPKKTEKRFPPTTDDVPSALSDVKECLTSSETTEDCYERKLTTTIL